MTRRTPRRVLMLLENTSFQSDYRPKREAATLMSAGYQLMVISPWPRSGGRFRAAMGGVDLYQYPPMPDRAGPLNYIAEYSYATVVTFLITLYVLFTRGFDVIHAHNPPDTMFLIGGMFKLLGKSFVYDHHDLAPEMYCARFNEGGKAVVHKALLLLEKLTCQTADHVITTNQSYREVEMTRDGVPPDRITVVRNGPEQKRMPPVEPDAELRARARTILGYLGRIGPQDGVDRLITAMKHLVFDLGRRDVLCVVVGDGDALPGLIQQAKDVGVADWIHFAGWVTGEYNIRRFLAATDICLVPEPSSPYNDRSTVIKLLEYMALGKPSVAFDLPEHRYSARGAALYAEPNDELDFARKIAFLIDNPAERQRMAEIGLKRIETELAWPFQARNLLKVYETVTGVPPHGQAEGRARKRDTGDDREAETNPSFRSKKE